MPYADPRIDLSPFEEAFGLPKIPVRVADLGPYTLGEFHPQNCRCGNPEWGISINLPLIFAHGEDPNSTLLHEAMHALHYFLNREDAERSKDEEHIASRRYGERYAYNNSKGERIARFGEEYLRGQGMQLWNP